MVIALDTKFHLDQDEGQPEIMASLGPGAIHLSLSADNFRIDYREGKAHVHLSRMLTKEQMRVLGRALLSGADELDKHEAEWFSSSQALNTPHGSVTIVKIQHDGEDCD